MTMDHLATGRLYNLPATSAEEIFTDLVASPGLRIERIVSTGQATPEGTWLTQAESEFVVLVAGAARLSFADPPRVLDMHPGDWVDIPAHCRHRVDWTHETQATVWLAVHRRDG